MGKRFLNTKTKEVYLGDNVASKLSDILGNYVPYQKTLVVTTAKFIEQNKDYYEAFLKQIKNPNKEYVFTGKIGANKKSASKFLSEVEEEIACIVVLGAGQIIELIKVVAYIKEIPYIIVPTKQFEPQHLCRIAKLKIDDLLKFYNVNAPLAVLLEQNFMLEQKRMSIVSTFCNMIAISIQLLDEFLVNVSVGNTLFPKHFSALKETIYETLSMQNKLYNFNKNAVLTLMKQALKMGLILQSLDLKNMDSATLSATAFFKLQQKNKVPFCYYKIIHSLFLVNIYESFVLNLKLNNFFLANIKERLKVSGELFCSKTIKTNLIKNIEECEHLKLNCYQIKEYEAEILEELKETKGILQNAYTFLKRMNLPLSYYVEKTINTEDIKKAICLAPDLSTSDNFLKVMCRFGVLDYSF